MSWLNSNQMIYNFNLMSRLNTQPDSDPFGNKLAIIASNMARINSQNKRLQELLNHQVHLDRLRQISDGSAQNWHKLANLAENVQELSVQAKTSRQKIHSSLSKHTQTLNKTLLTEIQNARSTLASFQSRLNHLKNKEKKVLTNELQRQRQAALERVQEKVNESLAFVERFGQKYEQQTVVKLKDVIESGKQDLQQKYVQCRINLGHLHNVVAFYHWKKTGKSLIEERANQLLHKVVRSINEKLGGIEFNLKRIKGEVDWMKARQKKNKAVMIKQQRKTTEQYQPMQQVRTEQVGMSIQEVEYELKGLQRILDYQTIIKKIKFEDINIEDYNKARSRIKSLREEQQCYTNFYKLKI